MKSAKFIRDYDCEAMFEIKLEYKSGSYLIIFGSHINGYFCCMPMLGLACEMSEPNDIRYNADKLERNCGFDNELSVAIAEAIAKYSCTENL